MKKIFTFLASFMLVFSLNLMAADVLVDPAVTTLQDAYTAAGSGDVLILLDGTYQVNNNINITKGITIKAQNPKQAIIKGAGFLFNTSNPGNVTIQDVILDATKNTDPVTYASYLLDFNGAYPLAINNILVENCTITKYGNCMLRANRGEGTCESLKINNCIINNNGYVAAYPFFQTTKTKFGPGSLELTNSTIIDFANEYIQNYSTAPAGGDNTATYLFKNNTFFNTVTLAARRPFSFSSGIIKIQKNIFVQGTGGTRTSEVTINAAIASSEFTDNVVHNYDSGALYNYTGWGTKTGNTDADPLFTDSANNDFTLPRSSSLIGANIGDPRWFPAPYTEINEIESSDLSIFPNPATDRVNFNKTYKNVEIYNIVGVKVAAFNNSNSISVKNLNPGNYFLRIVTEDETIKTQKLSKK